MTQRLLVCNEQLFVPLRNLNLSNLTSEPIVIEISTQLKLAKLTSLLIGSCLILMGSYYLELLFWIGELYNVALGTELNVPLLVKVIALAVCVSGLGIFFRYPFGFILLGITLICGTVREWILALEVVPFLPFSATLIQPLVALGTTKTTALWAFNLACVVASAISYSILRKGNGFNKVTSRHFVKPFAIILGIIGCLLFVRGLMILPFAVGGGLWVAFVLFYGLPLLSVGGTCIGISYLLLKR